MVTAMEHYGVKGESQQSNPMKVCEAIVKQCYTITHAIYKGLNTSVLNFTTSYTTFQ